MVEEYNQTGHLIMGVQEVTPPEVVRYGIVKLKEGSMQITDIIEKPPVDEAPSLFAEFGRFILNQDIVDILKNTPLGKGNELWIVDAIREYIKNGGVFFAKKVEDGEWLTTGDPYNYITTILKYAFERKDIGEDLKKFVKNIL